MPRIAKNRLELVTRKKSPALYMRGEINGRPYFESTGHADRGEAQKVLSARELEIKNADKAAALAAQRGGDPAAPVEHTLAEAIESYLLLRGASPTTATHLSKILTFLGGRPLRSIKQAAFEECLKAENGVVTAKATTATHKRAVATPLHAVLTHAYNKEWLDRIPKFELSILPTPRTPYLRPDEATALVRAAAPHLKPLLVWLIGTGTRMSEALELDWRYVDLRGKQATVHQKDPSGTPRDRYVHLQPVVLLALKGLPHRTGLVFRPARRNSKTLSPDGYMNTGRTGGGQIKSGWAGASQRAGLPGRWQTEKRPDRPCGTRQKFVPDMSPHVCRHTWASWHYALNKDLVDLQDEGGWKKLEMCRRYTKRCPNDYLADIADWFAGRVNLGLPGTADHLRVVA